MTKDEARRIHDVLYALWKNYPNIRGRCPGWIDPAGFEDADAQALYDAVSARIERKDDAPDPA